MPHPIPIPGSARARLITAGIAHFQADGYERASVVEIADEAGVTTGSLYHHFHSKLGLYRVIREEMERRMTERMEGAMAAVGGGRDGVRVALEVSFDAAIRFGVTRILAEAPPQDWPDSVAKTVEHMIPGNAIAAQCVVAAWRGALLAVANGSSPKAARSGLAWVLAVPA
ncbi:MAG TPA: TetR/AcrR family transcriptional regulator [Acidimicrobiia bacterium]|nr:TetR/AcrR family transcriptional regulator [Acidimicrobiia bacterium]